MFLAVTRILSPLDQVLWQSCQPSSWGEGDDPIDDPEVRVTGLSALSEMPSCKVLISLSPAVRRDIEDPGVELEGEYIPSGDWRRGRPVLRHSGGVFTLSVSSGGWVVESGPGPCHLYSGSSPCLCPANPRAEEGQEGQEHWGYRNNLGEMNETEGISVS